VNQDVEEASYRMLNTDDLLLDLTSLRLTKSIVRIGVIGTSTKVESGIFARSVLHLCSSTCSVRLGKIVIYLNEAVFLISPIHLGNDRLKLVIFENTERFTWFLPRQVSSCNQKSSFLFEMLYIKFWRRKISIRDCAVKAKSVLFPLKIEKLQP